MTGRDRGQAYTLEGVIAAIILASALLYGLQAVDVAPYTSDDRDDRRLDTLRTQVSDALSVAADNGTLRRAVTCINGTTGNPHTQVGQPPNDVTGGNVAGLGAIMNGTMGQQNRQYMILFDYWNDSIDQVDTRVVYPNVTSPNVAFTREPVTVTHRVTVFNSTAIREPAGGAGCQPGSQTVADRLDSGDPFWLGADTRRVEHSELHAVVTVRVIAW